MLAKNITYTDYNGKECTETFYFNLTKAELVEMQLSEKGGLDEAIKAAVASNDQGAIVSLFKRIILAAYGEKSDDGKRFNKSKEMSDAFSHTEAYSELFMELSTDADKASQFVNAVVPAVTKPKE